MKKTRKTRDKLAKLSINTLVEVVFYDHSSRNEWVSAREELKFLELEIVLVGYFIGATKKSYRFGMGYSRTSGNYAPTFTVLKDTIVKWRKLQYPKGHYVRK